MLLCQFCNKECKNQNSLRNHERLCKSNPARQTSWLEANKDSIVPWNKGLSKETDNRVAQLAETISKSMTGRPCKVVWTEEMRKEKSEWRKKLHDEHPEMHPNRKLAGNRNKMTYPEQVAFDWLTSNNISFDSQKRIDGKYVDFCIGQIVIEIDGERFHPIGNEKDNIRDEQLTNLGYKVHRIRSKERIEERLKDIFGL